MSESAARIRTASIFFVGGSASVLTCSLLTAISEKYREIGDFAAAALSTPSVHFAAFMFLAFVAAGKKGLFPGRLQPSMTRVGIGAFGISLIFPIGVMLMLFAGFPLALLADTGQSGNLNPPPPPLHKMAFKYLSFISALVVGGLFTSLVSASAVQYVFRKWPTHYRIGSTVLIAGVPLATALVGMIFGAATLASAVLEPVPILEQPPLLIVGQPVLGAVIGYWAHEAAQQAADSRAL